MTEKLIELVLALLRVIPVVSKWFSTSVSKAIAEDKKKLDKEEEEFKKTGRPRP